MLTYTKQRNTFGKLVSNSTDTATLALADDLLNDTRRQILTKRPWWFLEKDFTLTTQAATQFIQLPGDVDRIISSPRVTIGTNRYTPKESPSRDHWNRINLYPYSSDIPDYWYSYGNQLGFFPTPVTAGNSIQLNAKQRVRDLSIADYTTGTITTVATTGTTTTITGASVVWTAGMIGMWIRITAGTAANLGDGRWYQIASVPTSTTLTLMNPYGGTAITAGTATYTIGECSILPEAYDSLPLYTALAIYFTSVDSDETKAAQYDGRASVLMKQMEADHSNRTGGRVLDPGIADSAIVNPNLTITA